MDMMLEDFLTSFIMLFLAEFTDKTMIATSAIASISKRPVLVVLISTLAFIMANFFIPIVTYFTKAIVEEDILNLISSFLFVLFGIIYVAKHEKIKFQEISEKMFSIFTLVFLSELGDKTQLALLALIFKANFIAVAFLGGILGYFMLNLIFSLVLVKSVAWKKIPEKIIIYIAGVIFILVGIIGLISYPLKL